MWVCKHCTFENVGGAVACAACSALAEARPEVLDAQGDADAQARQERDDAAVAWALAASWRTGPRVHEGAAQQAQQALCEQAAAHRARRAAEAADKALAAQLAAREFIERDARQLHLARVRSERDAQYARTLQAAYDRVAHDMAFAARLQDKEGCNSARCRFCEKTCAQPKAKTGVEAASCRNEECWQRDRVHCPALLGCGHPCIGTRGEQVHPQKCQHKDCCGEDSQDECAICFDELTEFPCVQLGCGHVYHHPCLLRQIDSAKDSLVPGKQISFNLLGCPQCKVVMQADAIRDEMSAAAALVAKVDAEARRVAEHEEQGLLALSEADFQRETRKLFMFFLCKEPGCGKVFCGGRQACADAGGQGDPGAAPAAVCPDCQLAEMARQGIGKPCQSNPPHPNENLVRKCNYCCEVATFCCNLKGPIYMCNDCHSPPYHRRQNAKPCDPSKCAMRKLGKSHPEGITDGLIIGCLLCMGGALHP